jgi:hypothetical protein
VATLVDNLSKTSFGPEIMIELLAGALGELSDCSKDRLDVPFLEPCQVNV